MLHSSVECIIGSSALASLISRFNFSPFFASTRENFYSSVRFCPFIPSERKAAKNLFSARWKFMKIDEIASFSVSFGQENLLRGRPTEIINFQLAAGFSVC